MRFDEGLTRGTLRKSPLGDHENDIEIDVLARALVNSATTTVCL